MKPWIRRVIPQTLLVRALLILIVPTVLVQAISAYVFYDRHWDSVRRNMASVLAGEIAMVVKEVEDVGYNRQRITAYHAQTYLGLNITLKAIHVLGEKRRHLPDDLRVLEQELRQKIEYPLVVEPTGARGVKVSILLPSGVMEVTTSAKRLASATTYIFILWMTGAALVLLAIATLFLRNQIRPIASLAEAAENFGKGKDTPGFKPRGSREVRLAARAFVVMRERIRRQILKRTEMLAAVSHDLRTPLTRMKLQLAMLKDTKTVHELQADVHEMERMIEEYLDFARGSGSEPTQRINLKNFLEAITNSYTRQEKDVAVRFSDDIDMDLRVSAMKRCLANLIDNAIRHGTKVEIDGGVEGDQVILHVDDNGPGIAEEHRGVVFKAFHRLDTSRNLQTGGVGLGLTIAKDIVLAHGGHIALSDAPAGGLRVTIGLPL